MLADAESPTGSALSGALCTPLIPFVRIEAAPRVRITGIDLLPVRATSRTVWLFVQLKTDAGLIGLGEASDAFGFANTTADDAARMPAQLKSFFDSSTAAHRSTSNRIGSAASRWRAKASCRPPRSARSNRRSWSSDTAK